MYDHPPTQTKTTKWRSNEELVTVTTTRNSGESYADFRDRHEADVLAEAAVHPPDDQSIP